MMYVRDPMQEKLKDDNFFFKLLLQHNKIKIFHCPQYLLLQTSQKITYSPPILCRKKNQMVENANSNAFCGEWWCSKTVPVWVQTAASQSSRVIGEWGKGMRLWPQEGHIHHRCSWDRVSEQDDVPLTILTGQFGWHILGISADSMNATCTPSTNPHLQLQMVHNFFSSVYNSSCGWGWGERRFCSQASPVRWALSPTEPQCIQKTNSRGHTYSVLANHVPGILLWICTNATS